MTLAFVFPGQGSQSIGMLAALGAAEPVVRETFAEASEVLGYDLWQLVQSGPEADLGATERTQPAMLAAGVATWRVWLRHGGPRPVAMAGHSLGEYSALVCSEALDFREGLDLVRYRGQLMQQAVPLGEGAMAAILGLDDAELELACREAAQGQVVEPVNFNAPGQTVIAGNAAAVARAMEAAKARGAKRAVLLPVSVPSHSSLMRDAAERLAERLAQVPLRMPNVADVYTVDVRTHASTGRHPPVTDRAALQAGALGGHGARDARAGGHDPGRMRPRQGADLAQQAHRAPPGPAAAGARGPVVCRGRAGRLWSGRMSELSSEIAFVTGASRGIGRAIALELGRRGARVVGTATSATGAQAIDAYLAAAGIAGRGVVLNVADGGAVEACFKAVEAAEGTPSILVNNAGMTRDGLLLRMSAEDWQTVLDTDLSAVYRTCKAVMRGMMKARRGRIINIASVVGVMGNAGQTNYAAAKAGMIGFSKSLAREVGSRNITVNVVAPGFIVTDMTEALGEAQKQALLGQVPLGRLGAPEDVAAAVAFLASPAAAYISGETLHVNGGMYMI